MCDLTNELVDDEGYISPKAVARKFHTTIKEIAKTIHVSETSLNQGKHIHSDLIQHRLTDMIDIIHRASKLGNTPLQAFEWYHSIPLPSFEDCTAAELVKNGRADAVRIYIDRIAVGGYT